VSAVAVPEAFASDAAPDVLWPMPIREAISSNFAEYREGHLHAGLDIRTFGREGVPCRASAAGYVSRIRASATGYGKVIYLQLDSGETLVYAHLAEFAPELENVVRGEQERRRRYRVDLRLPPSRYPVQRGDVIGYSGMTGATAPHLHFEVRNEQEHPLDPFRHGFSVPDPLPPEFRSVVLLPLASDGRINGECYPLRMTPEQQGGIFVLADTLLLSGQVGVAARVFDRLNAESGRLAPHTLVLTVDGETRARIALERFSFTNTSQVDFVYEIGRVRTHKDYYFQLFHREGETLWDREFAEGGRLAGGLDPGLAHEARIVAADRSGNRAELVFWFRVNGDSDGAEVARVGIAGSPGTRLPGCYFFEKLMSVSPRARSYPIDRWRSLLPAGDDGALALDASDLSAVPVSLPVKEGPGAPAVHVVGLVRGESRAIRFAELELELVIGERTLYGDQVLYATRWLPDRPAIHNAQLVPANDPVRIGPYSMTLRADMEIRFPIGGEEDSTRAIYRLNEQKGEWVFYDSVADAGVVATVARRPGVYAVLYDRYPPSIRRPFVGKRERYADGATVPELVVPLEDSGSGIDDERTAIYIAGVPQIARWDFVTKKMFVELRDRNIVGTQTVSVVAFDQIGNRAHLDVTLDIPETP
jgi:hypothetical protein